MKNKFSFAKLGFIVIGLIIVIATAKNIFISVKGVETTATVTNVELKEGYDSDSNNPEYTLIQRYSYTVGGKQYDGSYKRSFSDVAKATTEYNRASHQQTIRIKYLPSSPGVSNVISGKGSGSKSTAKNALIAVFGLVLIFFGIKFSPKKKENDVHVDGGFNTDNQNMGYQQNGGFNTDNQNTGYQQNGNFNTGNQNMGYQQNGGFNTGNQNTGYQQNGNFNTGNQNTGYQQNGGFNTGNQNMGYQQNGGFNTGNQNTGYQQNGGFNTNPVPQQAPTKPKFCPNCGSPTGSGSYCESCGTKLI